MTNVNANSTMQAGGWGCGPNNVWPMVGFHFFVYLSTNVYCF